MQEVSQRIRLVQGGGRGVIEMKRNRMCQTLCGRIKLNTSNKFIKENQMDTGLIVSLIGLGLGIVSGLCAAVYNLSDDKGRQGRLEQRRIERKRRRRICAWF